MTIDKAQDEIVLSMTAVLERLARSKRYLTEAQRLFIGETLRDWADAFDDGAGDFLRARLKRRMFAISNKPAARL
jgi:hypothetical protein